MPDLHVSAHRLEQLATTQDGASNDMDAATAATDGIGDKVWKTHGYYPGCTNRAVEKAEEARRAACKAAQAAAGGLAETLRVARSRYARTDEREEKNIDEQVRDR